MTREELIIDNLKRMMKEGTGLEKLYALSACRGLGTCSEELIQQGLNDMDPTVRFAAEAALSSFAERIRLPKLPPIPPQDKRPISPDEPVSRTFEPPEIVYKMCVGDVIVLAEIPKDAWVRGRPGGDCRANKAIIKDVVGKYDIGISLYDPIGYQYVVGDVVEIKDFNRSNLKATTGFHFVCTLEEAQNRTI